MLLLYVRPTGRPAPLTTVRGVVAGVRFTPSGAGPANTVAIRFRHARVCLDANDNGACDRSRRARSPTTPARSCSPAPATIPSWRRFPPEASAAVPGVARLVFRAARDAASSPRRSRSRRCRRRSCASWRRMTLRYDAAVAQVAARLGISPAEVTADPGDRLRLGTPRRFLRNPSCSAAVSGWRRRWWIGETPRLSCAREEPDGSSPAITMKEAQQAAMALEGIPRYDHIFIIMLENKATSVDQEFAARAADQRVPRRRQSVHELLLHGQSERAESDRGLERRRFRRDRRQCVELRARGRYGESPGRSRCRRGAAVRQRDESQSQAPGQPLHRDDGRRHDVADVQRVDESWPRLAAQRRGGSRRSSPTITSIPADSPVGAIGSKGLRLPFPASLYMTKHNATVAFQDVRSSPEFSRNNRTMGGGQWDDAIRTSAVDARRLECRSVRRRLAVRRRRPVELPRAGPVR